MYKPAKFITEIPYKNFSTYYLFYKRDKILIPIEIEKGNSNIRSVPSIYNSMKRIIFGVGYSVVGIKIYHRDQSTFYTYVTIRKEKTNMDINVGFRDGIEIAREMSVPIYVKEKIIKECGIEITKDLVLKALRY